MHRLCGWDGCCPSWAVEEKHSPSDQCPREVRCMVSILSLSHGSFNVVNTYTSFSNIPLRISRDWRQLKASVTAAASYLLSQPRAFFNTKARIIADEFLSKFFTGAEAQEQRQQSGDGVVLVGAES